MSEIKSQQVGLSRIQNEQKETAFTNADSSASPGTQAVNQILHQSCCSRKRLMKSLETLKESLSSYGAHESQDSNTIIESISPLINQVVENLLNFDQAQQGAIRELTSWLKIKEQENQKLRERLAQIESLHWLELPEVKKVTPESQVTLKSTGVQTVMPWQPPEAQGIHIESYSMNILNQKIRDNIQKARFKVSKFKKIPEMDGLIGGDSTFFAQKNENSYMIVTSHKGLIIIEKDEVVYQGLLPNPKALVKDTIYIPPLNCYLIEHNGKVYRKNLDEKDPYIYLDWNCGKTHNCSFLYSNKNKRLILLKNSSSIVVLNLSTKEAEIEIRLSKASEDIVGFKLLGKEQKQGVVATSEGMLYLFQVNYGFKEGKILTYQKLDLFKEIRQKVFSIAACDEGKYLCVEIIESNSKEKIPSMILILKIQDRNFLLETQLGQVGLSRGPKKAIECYGYINGHIRWITLSSFSKGTAQMYDYDMKKKELKELKDKRIKHQEKNPAKLHRLGSGPSWLYTGEKGNLMKLSLTVKPVKKKHVDESFKKSENIKMALKKKYGNKNGIISRSSFSNGYNPKQSNRDFYIEAGLVPIEQFYNEARNLPDYNQRHAGAGPYNLRADFHEDLGRLNQNRMQDGYRENYFNDRQNEYWPALDGMENPYGFNNRGWGDPEPYEYNQRDQFGYREVNEGFNNYGWNNQRRNYYGGRNGHDRGYWYGEERRDQGQDGDRDPGYRNLGGEGWHR